MPRSLALACTQKNVAHHRSLNLCFFFSPSLRNEAKQIQYDTMKQQNFPPACLIIFSSASFTKGYSPLSFISTACYDSNFWEGMHSNCHKLQTCRHDSLFFLRRQFFCKRCQEPQEEFEIGIAMRLFDLIAASIHRYVLFETL